MKLPKLTKGQEVDLNTIVRIHKTHNNGARSPFWINYRYRIKSGEFSRAFEEYCLDMDINLNNCTYEERCEYFEGFIS